jgi:hypothetical protein
VTAPPSDLTTLDPAALIKQMISAMTSIKAGFFTEITMLCSDVLPDSAGMTFLFCNMTCLLHF